MKILNVLTWAGGIGAVLIIAVGTLSLLSGQNWFGIRHEVNFFHVANSLALLAILCAVAGLSCKLKDK